MSRVCLFAALLVLVPVSSVAADLRITDSSGSQVVVRNASIDYNAPLGAAVRESNGIRLQQGDGTVTLKWKDIEALTVVGPNDSSSSGRRDVEVLLRGGRRVAAVLLRATDARLRGTTDLGDYSLDLDKVRSIEPLR